MLEAIRKRSASFLVKLLFLLLVLSFGLWGIGDVISPNPRDEWAAKVGDVVIPNYVLRDEYQNELTRLRQILGDNIQSDQARALGLPAHALEQIVNRTLLDLTASDLGLVASDDMVRQMVQTDPTFQGQRGEFDKELFDRLVRASGLSETGYLDSVRGDIVRGQLARNAMAGTATPMLLANELYQYRNETRVLQYVSIDHSAMTEQALPDEALLREFYNENLSRFTAPEYRSVAAVILNAEDVASEVSITDQQLETAFRDQSAEFNEPERRVLEQITFKSREVGERAREQIVGGADFATVAQEQAGLDAGAIQLGTVTREHLLPELASAAFDLPEGGISNLLETPLGWHLIRVVSVIPAREQDLDDVRDKLRQQLARDKAVDLLIERSIQLEDALGGGATLEKASIETGLPVVKIAAIDRKGLDKQGEPVPGLPGGFVETVFETGESSESALIEAQGGDGYFVVRVDQVTPAAPKPFEVARGDVEAEWLRTKRTDAAEEIAKSMASRIAQGQSFDEVAEDADLTVQSTSPIKRSGEGASDDLDPALVHSAFQAEPAKPFTVTGRDATFVATVTNLTVPESASSPRSLVALEQDLRTRRNGDLLAQFTQSLAHRYPVEINRQAIDRLY